MKTHTVCRAATPTARRQLTLKDASLLLDADQGSRTLLLQTWAWGFLAESGMVMWAS